MCSGPPAHKQLLVAVQAGNEVKVAALLKKQVDITYCDEQGKTSIHFAARSSTAILELLLGACNSEDAARPARNGRTPLMTACHFGMGQNARMIMSKVDAAERAAHLNAHDDHFCNVLHYAAAKGHAAIVAWLLEAQAAASGDSAEFISAFDGGRNTPLHKAAMRGHSETVQLLIDAGANVLERNCDGMTPLACCEGAQTPEEADKFAACIEALAKAAGTTTGAAAHK